MMSAGAMGGGVSSAVSRAMGAHDMQRGGALALHALIAGAGAGILYTLIFLTLGETFFRWLGGKGAVLDQAAAYSAVLFSGASLVWISNTLSSIIRGTGNMRVPSVAITTTALLQIALGGVLALGWGPVPSFGMVGVAIGHIVATATGVAILLWFLMSGRGRLTLRITGVPIVGEMFGDILRVGAVALVAPVQSVFTVLILTGLVAHLGVLPLAGYSIGQRLEFLLIPIAFGVGVAAVPMVGMAIGAGNVARARRIAWTAGGVSALSLALIGFTVALAPDLWAHLFTSDEAVLENARQYLRLAGPSFPFFGLGLTLFFASQGAGKVLGPVLGGSARLGVVAAVAIFFGADDLGTAGCFALVAAGMCVYGISTATAVWFTPWGTRR
jgi:putative MATE family efflux protein